MNWSYPLLLDGGTLSNLAAAGLPSGQEICPELWITEHPHLLQGLQSQFLQAGAQILYAPTFGANEAVLKRFGLEQRFGELNALLTKWTKETAGKQALTAGCMSSTGLLCQPFGELSFDELTGIYANQAFALKEAGADLLVIDSMEAIVDARAAVLGARQTGLPLFAAMKVGEDGETDQHSGSLAALIVLQDLGISAFGLSSGTGPIEMAKHIQLLAPYAKVPLLAKPNAWGTLGERQRSLSPEEMGQGAGVLWENGAALIGGCCGTGPKHLEQMRRVLAEKRNMVSPHTFLDSPIILANDQEIFHLEETFELSETLHAGEEWTDILLEVEESGCDLISIQVDTVEEAHDFFLQVPFCSLPVSFLSHREEALEAALYYYCGKAMIDSRCEIPENVLLTLAKGYGAVIR